MKPIHIGLLIAAGALGGALMMKLAQPTQAPAPAPAVAQQQAPAQPEAQTPAEPPAPVAQAPAPSPFPEEKRQPVRPKPVVKPNRAPAVRHEPASAQPAPAPAPTPAPAPAPVAEPKHEEPAYVPPPPPPPPRQVTIAAGTLLPVRLVEGLSTDRNNPGDTFTATLDQPLIIDGLVIAERGARLEGKVVQSEKAGRVRGLSQLGIALTKLRTSDGQSIAIQTETFTKAGPPSVKEDVARGAAATAIGAAIGAIAGGGKGAAIGAGVGAAAGTGGALATRGKPAVLATETRLNFRLSAPVSVTERK